MKLLICEDISTEAEVLTRLYQLVAARFHGAAEIVSVGRWEAAVKAVDTLSFDVVMLDLGLPDSLTDETVIHIKEVSASWPPIVVVTGHDDREKELRVSCIRDGGASDLILKKVAHRDCEQLVERVWHAHLRGQHERQRT